MSSPIPIDSSSTLSVNDAERARANRAERLAFPPLYVLVGAYRLVTDKNLWEPTWAKCKHGAMRGAIVGLGWVRIMSTRSLFSVNVLLMLRLCSLGSIHVQHPTEVRRCILEKVSKLCIFKTRKSTLISRFTALHELRVFRRTSSSGTSYPSASPLVRHSRPII